MDFRHVWIVFKKEVKDIARDKKTLITSLLVPIILMPVLFGLLGGGMEKLERDINENITIALAKASDTEGVRALVENDIFGNNSNIRVGDSVADPVQAVRNGEARFVLELDEDFAEKLREGTPYTITVIYDQSDTKSSGSYRFIMDAINTYNFTIVQARLKELEVDPLILQPISVIQQNAADEKSGGNIMLIMILPMMVSILIAVGGIPAATDLVAGEKERSTFEPLLTTKTGRMSILFGKYMTVTLFSCLSVIAQFTGIVIGILINPSFITMGEGGSITFYVPPLALILCILITITLGMVFAGIQLAISTYAKSFKEAQTYLSFLIFAAMIPAYATMMMQPGDIQTYMFAVPLLNAIAALKMILGNVINYSNLGIALGSSLIYVIISLSFAATLFNKEKVLFRS